MTDLADKARELLEDLRKASGQESLNAALRPFMNTGPSLAAEVVRLSAENEQLKSALRAFQPMAADASEAIRLRESAERLTARPEKEK